MAQAQAPVAEPVGAGSVASRLPDGASLDGTLFQNEPIFWNEKPGTPVPTNDWWTQVLFSWFGESLWAFPFKVDTGERGLSVFLPTRWAENGRDLVSERPIEIVGLEFTAQDTRVESWGDWTLTMVQADTSNPAAAIRTTIGRGLPYVWMEFENVEPVLKLVGGTDVRVKGGGNVERGFAADSFLLKDGDRMIAVIAPPGTRFTPTGEGENLAVAFAGASRYLVLGAMTTLRDFEVVVRHARALPTDSELTWSLDRATGVVNTTWSVETRLLAGVEAGVGDSGESGGSGGAVLQGWLPHHLRDTTVDFELESLGYLTPRGTMQVASGNTFRIAWPFRGLLPAYPMPDGLPRDAIDRWFESDLPDQLPPDTYWAGKALLDLTRFAWLAETIGHPKADAIQDRLKRELVDWYTYTPASRGGPGEQEHYFARYPGLGAVVGMKPSYGSDKFNDHHFHYGYFAYASAVLGLLDPDFLDDYGPMATLVAREYANPVDDGELPKLRNFDPWAGHSWAGGVSSPGGNNQESSSEAVMSWIGLYLLGVALGDDQLTDTGAMGYAMETRATNEYWFDQYGTNWSEHYDHPVVGILWSGGQQYATYFSGDPAWVHAIQWIPAMPGMSYLSTDPDFVQAQLSALRRDRLAKEGSAEITTMGADLGKLVLGYEALVDPASVLKQIAKLRSDEHPMAENIGVKLVEADAVARRWLGREVETVWCDAPLSRVFVGPDGMKLVAWSAEDATAAVYDGVRKVEAKLPAGWSFTPIAFD
ncbi:MAG: glycosyl hydrolase [Planctomycetota bacterium]